MSDYASLPPEIVAILRRYFIVAHHKRVTPTGETIYVDDYVHTELSKPDDNGKVLGWGPVIDPGVIERFLDADRTPGKIWFEWMLLQAGGGESAKQRSNTMLKTIETKRLNELTSGYKDKDNEQHPPISIEEAKAVWAKQEPGFKRTIFCGDQDMLRMGVFGFYRNWPGRGRIYETLVQAVSAFTKALKNIAKMNSELQDGSEWPKILTDPDDYKNVEQLRTAVTMVQRYFESKTARDNIRIGRGLNGEKTVYDDDYLTIIVPLTNAAAVRYGRDEWQESSATAFEQRLKTGNEGHNPWRDAYRNGTGHAYIRFNVPMPSEVVYRNDTFQRDDLQDLSFYFNFRQKNFDPNTVTLITGRAGITLEDLKKRVKDEAVREYDPSKEEEYPVRRGARVYGSAEEAEEVVRHLDHALHVFGEWLKHFDEKSIAA